MAGHGSAPPATGWEGEVRKVLKEDWQVVCGIMGFYTTLYLISKLFTGGAKAVPEAGTSVGGDFGESALRVSTCSVLFEHITMFSPTALLSLILLIRGGNGLFEPR